MSDDQVSHHQAESLLRAMQCKDDVRSSPSSEQVERTEHSASIRIDSAHHGPALKRTDDINPRVKESSNTAELEVEDYDFREAVRLGDGQLDSFERFHRQIEKPLADALSSNLRADVRIELTRGQQLRHHDYVYTLEDPSCVGWVNPFAIDRESTPWICNEWLVSMTPNLVSALIDRMLGGEPSAMDSLQRPMTEIECRLISRVIDKFLEIVASAWAPVVEVSPSIVSVESTPRPFNSISANDRVVCLTFAMTLFKITGELGICIPVSAISHVINRFSTDPTIAAGATPSDETREQIQTQVAAAPIEVVVNVAQSTIRTSDLLDLRVGDIIATEKNSNEPMELAIQDVPKFLARAGSYQSKKAVQIESAVEKATDTNES